MAQSPHGELLQLDCGACHTAAGWDIPFETWAPAKQNKDNPLNPSAVQKLDIKFTHDSTLFPLTGRHALVDCRSCHESLVFSEASNECYSCHLDMHQQTVGMDCARCHTTNNWLVDDINAIHNSNGFPLLGNHALANCTDCHNSDTRLRFDPIGNECIDCHQSDFQATTNPNHNQAGFPTNCIECHDPNQDGWGTTAVDHSFFPLEKGHDIMDCASCHTGGNFTNTPTDCFACHQPDFESTQNPNHQAAGFSTSCTDCHTTDPDWMPATYADHDLQHFPIYSGAHQGEWANCNECHQNPSDYSEFTCVACHTNPETDNEHNGVIGYSYSDPACLACHPTGNVDDIFDHNTTNFPLTGAHETTQCIECHANGYVGTPTDCAACHTIVILIQTTNPESQQPWVFLQTVPLHNRCLAARGIPNSR
ncbi:MAG: cytochrome c3 family protein [Saprospiraceae bacterium]